MICMKKVKFSSHPTAKVRCHRPRGHGAARVQLALFHLQEQNQGYKQWCNFTSLFYVFVELVLLDQTVLYHKDFGKFWCNIAYFIVVLFFSVHFSVKFCSFGLPLYPPPPPLPCHSFYWGFLHVYRSPLYWDFTVTVDTCQLSHQLKLVDQFLMLGKNIWPITTTLERLWNIIK